MENKFDVIIVGAGPAGLKCAEQFKNSNLSVLLVEKNKVIGPKTCAGGLTQLTRNFDFPNEKTRSFKKQTLYLGGKKYRIDLVEPIRTIDRYELGQYLLRKIEDCKNITILTEAIVRKIQKDKIITNKGDFYYKHLVGADGSLSMVRSYLGLKSEISLALYYKIPTITNELEAYFMPKLLGSGYLWVFPHKNYTNIGIGIHMSSNSLRIQKLKGILEDFLEKNHFDVSDSKLEAAPINSLYKGCIFKNIFLVGDAAGLVPKITCAGIPPAIISGEEIGKKILDPDYRMPGLKKILRIKRTQERFGKVIDGHLFIRKYFFKIFFNLMKIKRFQLYFFTS